MDNRESTTVCPMDATPVQPMSLGDTPPVGNVHAATAAYASVSSPEVSPPANFKTRQLKITDAPGGGWVPGLRIQGEVAERSRVFDRGARASFGVPAASANRRHAAGVR